METKLVNVMTHGGIEEVTRDDMGVEENCNSMEWVVKEMVEVETCRRKEVVVKEMEEVATCRHREEEVMEMAVVEI